MAILIKALITIGFIMFMIPSLTWCYIALVRSRGEVSWKLQKFHRRSWYTIFPVSILVVTIGIILLLV